MAAPRRRAARCFAIAITAAVFLVPTIAFAQFDEEEEDDERRDKAVHSSMSQELDKPNKAVYGVGLRLRYVFFPKGLIELFVEEASSGIGHPGFGLEFVRKKNDFSIHLGIEHESVSPEDGRWLEKGDDPSVPGEFPDDVDFDGLKWTTLDVQFMFLKNLAKGLDLRYGAGFGIGIVHGDALQTDQVCTAGTRPQDIQNNANCMDDRSPGAQVDDPADIPPVFPVVNIVVGAQYSPIENLSIYVEGGMRTLFFFGLGTAYFF